MTMQTTDVSGYLFREDGVRDFGRHVMWQDLSAVGALLAKHPADGWAATRASLIVERCKHRGEHPARSETEGVAKLEQAAKALRQLIASHSAWREGTDLPPEPIRAVVTSHPDWREGTDLPPEPIRAVADAVDVIARYWVPGVQAAHRGRLTEAVANEALQNFLVLADSARRSCFGPLPARIQVLLVEVVIGRAVMLLVGTAARIGALAPYDRFDITYDGLRTAVMKVVDRHATAVNRAFADCREVKCDADGLTLDQFIKLKGGSLLDRLDELL